ncbi:MAG TPA: kelch repeat-containing protein [Clostridia bacterium]|nr:kelch repeat-containing protein [Clostridia bacterium]
MKDRSPAFLVPALVAFSLLITACGGSGGGSSNPQPSPISISISPQNASALVASPLTFSATVSGAANAAATFIVVEGTTGGQITSTGSYIAPATPGTYHVRAISAADSTRTADAVVTVRDYARTIQRTPDPSDGYDYHTATLLQDGSVLVVGGKGIAYTSVHRNAERYISSENRFVAAAALNTARMEHAAALLPNGKVLVSGGKNFSPLATDFDFAFISSELYNPAAAQFVAGPSMKVPRRRHVFTLLKDGRVLVTGGIQLWGSGFGASPSVEIYDSTNNQFVSANPMSTGRWRHTATLLPDGRVLIVGGRDNNCELNCPVYSLKSAELFDPVTGQFTATGSLQISRFDHTATLLPDGRVLILGGETTENIGQTDQINTGEVWDPATGQFTTFGSMTHGRSLHTITLLNNGKYLVAGGNNWNGAPSVTTEIFDATNGTSIAGPDMNDYRIRHTATRLVSGEVLIVGGFNSGQAVLPVDLFR